MKKKIKKSILYFILFGLVLAYFSFLQSPQVLPDPDSFYHTRMAQILSTSKIQQNFPFLKFTTLNNGYVDQHFLYHLFLVPFVKIFSPLRGVKIAQTFLTSFFILFFYWFLKKEKIKYPLFWVLILVFNSPFIFRVLLIKANSLSLIFLLLGIYAIFDQKYWLLFIVGYFYVLAYGGWPLLLIAIIFYLFSLYCQENFCFQKKKSKLKYFLDKISPFKKEKFFQAESSKIFWAGTNGMLLGVFLNPYFFKNIYFYYQQIIQIGIINYQDKINVGGEWSAYHFLNLAQDNKIVFLFFFLALILFFLFYQKQNAKSLTLFSFSILFLGATLKSRRYIEYLIPFLILFSAFTITLAVKGKVLKNSQKIFWDFYNKHKISFFVLVSIFILGFVFVSFGDVLKTKNDLANGLAFNYYQGAGEYLKNNSQPGEIVFTGDWDDFPPLFYYAPNNYYIVGLDPTFLYNYNNQLYQEYADITTGKDGENLSQKIANDFLAHYVFLDNNHINFNDNLIRDKNFKLVYKDKESLIYKLK